MVGDRNLPFAASVTLQMDAMLGHGNDWGMVRLKARSLGFPYR